jgi:hypothetical protein
MMVCADSLKLLWGSLMRVDNQAYCPVSFFLRIPPNSFGEDVNYAC